jgi:hypothetical protein
MNAESRAAAEREIARFAQEYGGKHPKAVAALTTDQARLLAYFDSPAEHWKHSRTSRVSPVSWRSISPSSRWIRPAPRRSPGWADVVKIVNPKTGDPGRQLRPGKPDDDPWHFHMFNANKKSLTMNLKSSRGFALVKETLKADVTVEHGAPGTIERLGLGSDVVTKINAGIISCQIQGSVPGASTRPALPST